MKPRDRRNLAGKAVLALLAAVSASSAAAGQNLPVRVGQDYESALAALKEKGIAFQQSSSGADRKISYSQSGESVALDFSPWPKDQNAPASAWEAGSQAPKVLTLTRIRDEAPSSAARRAWVNSLAKEGRGWSYLTPEQDASRPVADRTKYPVAAGLQWRTPPARLLFQAARAAGTAPGDEASELVIELTKPTAPQHS